MELKVKKVAIGSDHNGFAYKEELKKYLVNKGYLVKDFGQFTKMPPAKDFKVAEKLALAISENEFDRGILICGTGDGMCIVANKIQSCRASLCYNLFSTIISRKRNNSNILTMGAKTMKLIQIKKIVDIWLTTHFDDDKNEQRNIIRSKDLLRIDKQYRK